MIESVSQANRIESSFAKNLLYWLPPLLWMSVIFIFSTDIFAGENTGSTLWAIASFVYPAVTREEFGLIHFYIRKAAHFTEYAVLALLLFRAFRSGAIERWRWSWTIGSLLVVVVYALLDEYHQTFTGRRTGAVYDSLIDISGGVVCLFLIWLARRRRS
jgi:VanZ family protein